MPKRYLENDDWYCYSCGAHTFQVFDSSEWEAYIRAIISLGGCCNQPSLVSHEVKKRAKKNLKKFCLRLKATNIILKKYFL